MAINVKGLSGVSVDCVADWDVETSSPDWNIKLDTREDYYTWNEGFTATHKLLGSVVGNEDGEITCYPIGNVLKELEQSFNENVDCTLGQFDTWDI